MQFFCDLYTFGGLKSSTENNKYKFGIKDFVSIKYITEKIVILEFFLNTY